MTLFRKKRLLKVVGIVAALGICAGGFVAVRMRMIRHSYLVARDKGYAEYQHGDSAGTIRDLGMYLSAYPQDGAALEAFAESRLRVEEPDGSHLFGAIGAFRRLADLRPDSDDIQRRLVGLYAQANLNTESLLAANKLLDKTPKGAVQDASLMHSKAMALLRLRKFSDALAAMDDYLKQKPEDLEGQVIRLEILSRTGPPEVNLVEAAGKVRLARPDDPRWKLPPSDDVRWKLLQSLACGMARDGAGSKKWAAECAGAAAPDLQFARLRVLQLWQTGQTSLGDAALDSAMKQFADDSSLRILRVRRLYQQGKHEELLKLAPADADTASARAILGGYQCLAWIALKEPKKAEALRAQLAGNAGSVYARDWAAVIAYAIDSFKGESTSRARIIKEIAQRHLDEAYFEMALAAASRNATDAMQAWAAAAIQEPAWADPWTRMAETLLRLRRTGYAVKAAKEAVDRGPEDRDALVAQALARAQSGPDPDNGLDMKSLLSLVDKMVDNIHAKFPDEQRILALRVSVKTQMLGKAAGVAAVTETLGFQPPPSMSTLLQMAMVSRRAGLGQEANCFSTAERLYGMAPELAYEEAITLAEKGQVAEGKALMEKNRNQAATDRQEWDIEYARYLELNHDPGAKGIWTALGDTYPSDLQTQWLVLRAPSIQADHAMAGRTIERLRKLIDENDFSFKLERARWLLSTGQPGDAAVTEATGLLTDMSKGAPDELAPHLLLAGCFEQSENFSGAIDQLEIAATLAPDQALIQIELARLLQNQGNMERAGIFVNKLVGRLDLNDAERRQCSGLLVRQGQLDQAIAFLEAGLKAGDDTETVRLILASLYAQHGQTEKAGAMFDELMKQPNLAIVRLSAAFYASHNRLGDAQRAILGLGNLKLAPAVIRMEEGDFATRFGKPEEALAAYEKSLEANPADVQVWYRLIRGYLQQGKDKEAQESIARALEKVPGDKTLAALQKNKRFIEALSGDVRSRPILMTLISEPHALDAVEAVLARLEKSHGAGAPDEQLARDINILADHYPQYAALQNLAVDLDVSAGHLEDAVAIATRAMQTFPSSPEPARLAAAAFAAANNWSGTLGASNEWRLRSQDQTLAPDVMIGLSYLGMGKPDATLKQIEPYMPQAANDPDSYGSVIVLFARSEIAKNHIAIAEAKLWPLAKASKRGLATFMQVAGHDAPPETADRWLRMARGELKGDMDLELAFVTAVADLARRSDASKLMATALDDMEKLVASTKDEPLKLSTGYLVIGMIQEGQKAPDAGEASYRHAVELNPQSATACNNLAMVLARRGALPEALSYGNKAVEISPKVPAFQDTLAFIQDKAGDHANAIKHSLVALQLQPDNPEWRINLAQAYLDDSKAKDDAPANQARLLLVNRDGTPYRPEKLEPELQGRLSALQQRLGIRS